MRGRILIGGLVVLLAAASVGYVASQRHDYNEYVDTALNEYGPYINFIYAVPFSRDETERFNVSIDSSMSETYSDYIQTVYSFLAKVSNRAVNFELVSTDVLNKSDRFVFVGNDRIQGINPHTYRSSFAEKLQQSISQIYQNPKDDVYWKILNMSLIGYYGRPLFFNSDFATMDFELAEREKKYELKSKKIEKAAVYINVPPADGATQSEIDRFTKFLILQEIFQEYNLAADIADNRFQLRTILYDNDEAWLNSSGAEAMRGLAQTASSALCPYDVMLVSQLHASPDSPPRSVGWRRYLSLYAQAYWYRYTSSSDLFDDRCW